MRKNFLLFIGCAYSIFFFSCQQELPDIISQVQQCRIDTGFYDDNQRVMDFTYDNSGRAVKLTDQDGYYLYTYSGDRISTRRYTDTISNSLLYVDSVFYTSTGLVSELRSYDYSGWMADTVATRLVYQYQNNQLSQILNITSWNNGFGMVHDTFPAIFHWNNVGNIEKVVYVDNLGDPVDSIRYQYDAHPNYFKIAHPHFYLLDPAFQIHVGLEANLPYFYSKNNVVNSNIYGSFDYPVTYGLDSANKLTRVQMGGIEYARYKYSCQ